MTIKEELKGDYEYIRDNVPIIYKYIDCVGGKLLLKNSSLLLRNPSSFNDPYDCYLGLISFKNMPTSYVQKLVNQNQELLKRGHKLNQKEKTDFEKQLQNISKVIRNSQGILCFTEDPKNLLMWSHYAKSHTGICIGFNTLRLYEHIRSLQYDEVAMFKVHYTNQIEPVNYFHDGERAIINWLRTKSIHWDYEKEIRLSIAPINIEGNDRLLIPIGGNCIEEIYLGSNIKDKQSRKILNICKHYYPEAKIVRMDLSDTSFSLTQKTI